MTDFHGKFVWYELMTTDAKAAESFYSDVVGWSMRDAGVPGMSYTLLTAGGLDVAGLMASPNANARPSWIGYIAVTDVDQYANEVQQSGGTICHVPTDIPDVGRFAVVTDPQGVAFALFKPLPRDEVEPPDPRTPGRTGWHELHAADGATAFGFYEGLFGWTKGDALDMGLIGFSTSMSKRSTPPPNGSKRAAVRLSMVRMKCRAGV
jgi:predicted enzyme related to lactoylglutathione lyase